MRVGRAALDEEAIRLIEEFNPEVEFDWTRILKGQGAETKPAASRERDYRAERAARRRPEPHPVAPRPSPTRGPTLGSDLDFSAPRSGSDLDLSDSENRDLTPVTPVTPQLGSDLDFSEPKDRDLTPAPRPTDTRLGAEGLLRLRARYAEVLARISERIQDPARQEELKAQAERLNPDTWVTDAEVDAGLEAYESVFDGLRSAIGGPSRRRRRKRRRVGGHQAHGAPGEAGEQAASTPEGDAPAEDDQSEER